MKKPKTAYLHPDKVGERVPFMMGTGENVDEIMEWTNKSALLFHDHDWLNYEECFGEGHVEEGDFVIKCKPLYGSLELDFGVVTFENFFKIFHPVNYTSKEALKDARAYPRQVLILTEANEGRAKEMTKNWSRWVYTFKEGVRHASLEGYTFHESWKDGENILVGRGDKWEIQPISYYETFLKGRPNCILLED